jgi:putative N6-adenine-specific DNA methylase
MCGSGTFLVEAARMAMKIPSQHERQFFAFMNWPDFDATRWQIIKQQALSRIYRGTIAPIIGSDIERRAVRYADRNIREAGLSKRIELHEADFFAVSAPYESGMVVTNPPYDERLSIERGAAWYADIGHALKHFWTGWDAHIVSGFIDGLYALGLTPKQKTTLDNGGIPAELWHIPIYAGSRSEEKPISNQHDQARYD